jgi:hypothetical protein
MDSVIGFLIWATRVSVRITWLLLAELPGHLLIVVHRNVHESRGKQVVLMSPLVYHIVGLIGTSAALWMTVAVTTLISRTFH